MNPTRDEPEAGGIRESSEDSRDAADTSRSHPEAGLTRGRGDQPADFAEAARDSVYESPLSLTGALRRIDDGVQLLDDLRVDVLGLQEFGQAVIVGLANQGRRIRLLVETLEDPVGGSRRWP